MPAERCAGARVSVPFSSLPLMLEYHAKRTPDAPAILAPGRSPLTYGRLYQHIDEMGRTLRAIGIGRRHRVAVVLPNGPEMAVAFLAVAANAVCAPINPAYGTEELDRYFAALRPRALITQAGIDSPARHAALSRGVRLIELSSAIEAEAGLFTLAGERGRAPPHKPARPSDVALVLLTSGTTSRPKIVPQTHANLCASACASIAALALTGADLCLNVVPLFHGHGLHNTLLASLAAGSGIACTPGCDVDIFFAWLREFRPTWYSAVPTIHQAILAQARQNREQVAGEQSLPQPAMRTFERRASCLRRICDECVRRAANARRLEGDLRLHAGRAPRRRATAVEEDHKLLEQTGTFELARVALRA